MNKLYGFIYKLLGGIVRRVYRVRVSGKENEPENGPFIVCANHLSNHDVVLLAACMKHQIRFAAKAELFKVPLLSGLVKSLGAYPIERGKGDVGAIKKTIRMLQDGEVIGFFPQGHRCPGVHPSKTEVKSGIGMITARAKVTVLPVSITPKKFKMRFFRKTYITIGKPIEFSEYGEIIGNKTDYERISEHIFARICAQTDGALALASGNKSKGALPEAKKDGDGDK